MGRIRGKKGGGKRYVLFLPPLKQWISPTPTLSALDQAMTPYPLAVK
jgi:hypothetical protein